MPEHLRALLVILVLASLVFAYVPRPAFGMPIAAEDLRRRRNLWFGITLLAFLAHNFSIYIVGAAVLLLVTIKAEKNPLALFLFLLFAVPPFSAKILGVGVINQLFEINHLRLLSLTILLPAWYFIRKNKETEPLGRFWADRFILCYLFVNAALVFGFGNFTAELRPAIIYPFMDIFLPYYVASRSLRSLAAAKDALASLVISCLILAAIGVFEFLKSWLLYSSLPGALGVELGMGNYLGRGDLGVVRALASAGHGIALGYVLAIALLLYQFVQPRDRRPVSNTVGSLVLLAGSIAALSRGPWVGLAAGVVVFTLMSANRKRDFSRLLSCSFLVLIMVLVSPYRDRVINLLPFIGDTDAGSVTYRQMLLENSLLVISQRPWFGGGNYYNELASMGMVQGEGIVDLVNTYLSISLSQGCVGLVLFVGVFAAAGARLFRAWNCAESPPEAHLLGRSLISALVAMLVTIATVSPILCIPTLYWALAGLCVGCARFLRPCLVPAKESISESRKARSFGGNASGNVSL
jgi:O-antigen ligase